MAKELPEGFVIDAPDVPKPPEGFVIDTPKRLNTAEDMFTRTNETVEQLPGLDGPQRASMLSARKKLDAATYLSELTGVNRDQIAQNYESFSKAHHYSGNHEADWQHMSTTIQHKKAIADAKAELAAEGLRISASGTVEFTRDGAGAGISGERFKEIFDLISEDKQQQEVKETTASKDKPVTFLEGLRSGGVPIISAPKEFNELAELGILADRFEQNPDSLNHDELIDLLDAVVDLQRPRTIGGGAGEILTELPDVMASFMASGPLGAMTKGAAKKTMEKMVAEGFKDKVQKHIMLRAGVFVGGKGIEAAGRLPIAAIPFAPKDFIERISADIVLSEDEEGDIELLITGSGKGATQAIKETILDSYIEVASEMSGGVIQKGGQVAAQRLARYGVLKSLIKSNPGKTVAQIKEAVKKTGFNGILGEMFEERVGDVARDLTGLEDFVLPTKEQLASEFIAFAIPGASVKVATMFPSSQEYKLIGEHETEEEIAKQRQGQTAVAAAKGDPEAQAAIDAYEMGEAGLPENITPDPKPEPEPVSNDPILTEEETEAIAPEQSGPLTQPLIPNDQVLAAIESVVVSETEASPLDIKEAETASAIQQPVLSEADVKEIFESIEFTPRMEASKRVPKLIRQVLTLESRLEKLKAAKTQEKKELREKLIAEKKAAIERIRAQKDAQAKKAALALQAVRDRFSDFRDKAAVKLAREVKKRVNIVKENFRNRQNLNTAMKELKAIVQQLPRKIRGDLNALFPKLSSKISQEAHQNVLNEASERVLHLIDSFVSIEQRKKLEESVKKGLKRTKKAAEFETFRQIEEVGHMDRDQVESELNEILAQEETTPEQRERAFFLDVFGAKLNRQETPGFTAEEMTLAAEEAAFITREARTSFAERVQAENERRQQLVAESLQSILGERKLKTDGEIKASRAKEWAFKRAYRNAMDGFNSLISNWEFILDEITHDKSQALKGFFSQFVRARLEARKEYFRETTRRTEAFIDFLRSVSPNQSALGFARYTRENATHRETNISLNGRLWTASKNEAIGIWMKWQDRSIREQMETQGWSNEAIEQLEEEVLNDDGIAIAQYLLSQYKSEFPRINDTFRSLEGYNLRQVTNYSPIRRENDPVVEQEGFGKMFEGTSTAKSRSFKARTKSKSSITYDDAFETYMRHIFEMEHYVSHGALAQNLRAIFDNPRVKRAIRQMNGEGATNMVDYHVKNIINGGAIADATFNWLNTIRGWVTRSSLAIKPLIMIKQLTSIPAYLTAIPTTDFSTGLASFGASPIKAIRTLQQSDWLKQRWAEGHDRDVRDLIKGAKSGRFRNLSITELIMLNVKLGDVGAIYMGGWAVYRHHYRSNVESLGHEEANRIALQEFELASQRTQQDAGHENLSRLQNGNAILKFFTMYMTNPASYTRVMVNAIRQTARGRMSKAELAKTIFVFQFLLPNLFQFVSEGLAIAFTEDDDQWDELLWRHKRASILGPLNGLGIVGDWLEFGLDLLSGREGWKASIPIIDTGNEIIEQSIASVDAIKEEEYDKLIEEGIVPLLDFFGVPAESTVAHVQNINKAVEGDSDFPLQRLLGYSDYALAEETD